MKYFVVNGIPVGADVSDLIPEFEGTKNVVILKSLVIGTEENHVQVPLSFAVAVCNTCGNSLFHAVHPELSEKMPEGTQFCFAINEAEYGKAALH